MPTHSNLYISPARVLLQNDGPRFTTTVLKGFTTSLTASIVAPGGASVPPLPADAKWEWTVVVGDETLIDFIPQQNQQVVGVKGNKPGMVTVQASLKDGKLEHKNTVEITVEESDLLIYAPDGYVYRVPQKVWANHKEEVKPGDDPVQVFTMDNVPSSVQSLLIDEVPVANVPMGVGSDNITCFLLNLNSILLNPGK